MIAQYCFGRVTPYNSLVKLCNLVPSPPARIIPQRWCLSPAECPSFALSIADSWELLLVVNCTLYSWLIVGAGPNSHLSGLSSNVRIVSFPEMMEPVG